jgi:hypothetical protein
MYRGTSWELEEPHGNIMGTSEKKNNPALDILNCGL